MEKGNKARNKKHIHDVPRVGKHTRRKASHLGREAREWWGSWFPFYVGCSQKASLIKCHCEQRSEGNEGANYVAIWEKTIPEKGREFWDISKYKLANCV